MEDLSDFEAATRRSAVKDEIWPITEKASSSSAGSASARVEVSGEADEGTPMKRQRRDSDSSFASRPSLLLGPAKKEEEDTPTKHGAAPRCEALDKPCVGCGRSRSGPSYYRAGEELEWGLSQKRGLWCKDCHTTWRTLYSVQHPLGLFAKWVREPQNAEEFEISLLSYVSLAAEGPEKITAPMLQTRARTLRFLSKLLGFSLCPTVIVPLAEALPDFANRADVDPSKLVTMRTQEMGNILGIQMPANFKDDPTKILRPLGETPMLWSRSYLSTSSPTDQKILLEDFGVVVAAKAEEADDEKAPTLASKHVARLRSLTADIKGLMKHFESPLWPELKESKFKAPLEKMSDLAMAAAAAGDPEAADAAGKWAVGLRAAKEFLRQHRDCARSNFKDKKILDLALTLPSFLSFLRHEVKFQPAASLTLLNMKVAFMDAINTKKSLSQALETILNDDLAEAFTKNTTEKASSGTSFSPQVWLESMVLTGWCDVLASKDEGSIDGATVELQTDTQKAADCLRAARDVAQAAKALIGDLDSLSLILSAGADKHITGCAGLNKALESFENAGRLCLLKKRLLDTNVGKSIFAAATFHVQASAKDAGADQKLSQACTILGDARLPRLSEKPNRDAQLEANGFATVDNFNVVTDGTIVDVLEESMLHIAEALRLWSPLRLEQQAPAVAKWSTEIVRLTAFCDEASCVYLQSVVEQHMTKVTAPFELAVDGPDEDATVALELLTDASWLELCKHVQARMHNESRFVDFTTHLAQFLTTTCPQPVRSQKGFVESASAARNKVFHNTSVRANLVLLFSRLLAIQELPAAACEAVEDWKQMKQSGNANRAFFSNARLVQETVSHLQGKEFNLGDWVDEDDIIIELDEGAGLEQLSGSIAKASTLVNDVLRLPVLMRIRNLLTNGVQITVDDLAASLRLDAIMQLPVVDAEGARALPVPELLARLFVPKHWPAYLKSAVKLFASGAERGGKLVWPCEVLADLAKELFSIAGNGRLRVSLIQFGSDEGETWTDEARIWRALDIWIGLSQVAAALAYLSSRCGVDGGLLKDTQMKQDIELSLSMASTKAKNTIALIDNLPQDLDIDLRRPTWLWPSDACKAWLNSALAALDIIARQVVVKLVKATAALALEVQRYTPKWDHIITPEKVNNGLAKIHLLQWPSRRELQDEAIALFHSMSDCSRLYSTWLGADITEDMSLKEDVAMAEGTWQSARQALTIIAAFNILIEMTGVQKLEGAKKLLEKRREMLPPSLVALLQKVK